MSPAGIPTFNPERGEDLSHRPASGGDGGDAGAGGSGSSLPDRHCLAICPQSFAGRYSEGGARWVGEAEDTLLWVDLGDVVDADQEPRSPEQTGADFERFGFVVVSP